MNEAKQTKRSQEKVIFVCVADLDSELMDRAANNLKLRREAEAAVREQRATFSDLVTLEPALQWLMDDAVAYRKSHGKKKTCCANARWYGYGDWKGRGIKERLLELVGNASSRRIVKPPLRSSYAYDLAYDSIYRRLPNCRNCGCL